MTRVSVNKTLLAAWLIVASLPIGARAAGPATPDPTQRAADLQGKVIQPNVIKPTADARFNGQVLQFPTVDTARVMAPENERAPIAVVGISPGPVRAFQTRNPPVLKIAKAPENGKRALIPHIDQATFAGMLKQYEAEMARITTNKPVASASAGKPVSKSDINRYSNATTPPKNGIPVKQAGGDNSAASGQK